MGSIGRLWLGLWIGVLPIGLILTACENPDVASEPEDAGAPSAQPLADANSSKSDAEVYADALAQMVVNVVLTDDGFEPSSLHMPVGRRIKLVVRNRGTQEHHYRVIGLTPRNLEWHAPAVSEAEIEAVIGTEAEHDSHHTTGFAPFRGASLAGIKPFGDEVHAYVDAALGVDMVLFVPAETGTFEVECPLHPEVSGKVTVF
jgi:hypothetical protein